MKTLIKNGILIIDGTKRINNGAVLLEDKKIVGIYKNYNGIEADKIIDAKGNYIIPGLLDTHTHGVMGYDFNECSKDEVKKISDALVNEGVTGFMASVVTESHDDTIAILKMYEACNDTNMIGVHLEGPYINIEYKAVMKEEHLRAPDIKEFDQFMEVNSKIVSMTIAPELPNALELISYASNKGVVMNIGHSNANAQMVIKAQEYGVKGITHLYNAMSQHLHRQPGVVTGAISSDLMCELIVDGFHIDKDIIHATYKAIGRERIVLISDSNPCKGLSDGEYEFSGKHVVIIDGKARVKETSRIAGSTLTMNQACCNMMKYTNCSIDDAVKMASTNPAELYGLNKGKIAVGYDSDIVIVNDNFDILLVVNKGVVRVEKNF